jgi:hypothetical protein
MTNTTHPTAKSSTPQPTTPTKDAGEYEQHWARPVPLHLGHRPSSLSNSPSFAMLSLNSKQNAVLSPKIHAPLRLEPNMLRTIPAKRLTPLLLTACAVTLLLPSFTSAQKPDKTETLKKARQSYYSLKDQGLTEFQCTMAPNWAFLLAEQRKNDPAGIDAAIQKLQALHFGLTLGLDGVAKVTHNELTAENEQVANGLKQVYSGMEQMAVGFFQTWSAYTISPAFPDPATPFELNSIGSDYVISYKEGSAEVTTTMAKDYAISSMRVKTSEFDSTIKPQFKKIPKGLLISGYQALYRGATAAEATDLDVTIDYQDINGLQIPQEISLSGSYGASPFKVKVNFSACTATKSGDQTIAQITVPSSR